ncbi:hypothetical protein D3874_08215 [Oleomonas cavernae]|uniref:Uncharacterized protein n=1 Tax=Oleomonas cavernae TaxID=2320859 RepID=A0A418WAN3_9PROT|nr:hypothetical protein [Oleomonas cavernae]RJF87004.1 hypothetical protein D3874_08215 [Oleomonas cavernae]
MTGQVHGERTAGAADTAAMVAAPAPAAWPATTGPVAAAAIPAAAATGGGAMTGAKLNSRPRGATWPRPVGSRARLPQSVRTG